MTRTIPKFNQSLSLHIIKLTNLAITSIVHSLHIFIKAALI